MSWRNAGWIWSLCTYGWLVVAAATHWPTPVLMVCAGTTAMSALCFILDKEQRDGD